MYGFPGLGLLRGLRPIPAPSADDGPARRPPLAGRGEGGPEMVPTFTTDRSTGEAPSYSPAASPRVRRRLSSWPPGRPRHRLRSRPAEAAGVHCWPGPYPPGWSRFCLRGFNHWFCTRTPSRLACRTRAVWQCRPVPSLSGLLPPSPALQGQAALSFSADVQASFAPVAKHYGAIVTPARPGGGTAKERSSAGEVLLRPLVAHDDGHHSRGGPGEPGPVLVDHGRRPPAPTRGATRIPDETRRRRAAGRVAERR
jgi:hypothetical protein